VVLLGLARAISYLFMDLEVRGRLPAKGRYLIAPRHLSLLDPLVLARILDRHQLESLYWAGWTGMLFSGPVTHWLSRCAGQTLNKKNCPGRAGDGQSNCKGCGRPFSLPCVSRVSFQASWTLHGRHTFTVHCPNGRRR